VDALTAFQACASAAGSLALGLALVHGRVTAGQVDAAVHVDESFQIETWGEDALARERRDNVAKDIAAAGEYLRLVV
jgi:chaperone required for assembly of F1-ATPase